MEEPFPPPIETYDRLIHAPLDFVVQYFRDSVTKRDSGRFLAKIDYVLVREEQGRLFYRGTTRRPRKRGKFMETFGPPEPVLREERETILETSSFRKVETTDYFDHRDARGKAQQSSELWLRSRTLLTLMASGSGTLYHMERSILPVSQRAKAFWAPQEKGWLETNLGLQDVLVGQIEKAYSKHVSR